MEKDSLSLISDSSFFGLGEGVWMGLGALFMGIVLLRICLGMVKKSTSESKYFKNKYGEAWKNKLGH